MSSDDQPNDGDDKFIAGLSFPTVVMGLAFLMFLMLAVFRLSPGFLPGGDNSIITGFVFNDLNGNGVKDPTETGLSLVNVQLYSGSDMLSEMETLSDGSYVFGDLASGEYTIVTAEVPGWYETSSTSTDITLTDDAVVSLDTGYQQYSTLSCLVYDDVNENGLLDVGELGKADVNLTLTNSEGVSVSNLTSSSGNLVFSNLVGGNYTLVEIVPGGWHNTTDRIVPVEVLSGSSETAELGIAETIVIPSASVSGVVYDDLDRDGVRDGGEPGIEGVTVTLMRGEVSVASTTSGSDGSYTIGGLSAGAYDISEADPEGYVSTTPNEVEITLSEGGSASVDFGDTLERGSISVIVYHDANNNETYDSYEEGLNNVNVTLSGGELDIIAQTGIEGNLSYTDLLPGLYNVTVTRPTTMYNTTENPLQVEVTGGTDSYIEFGFDVIGPPPPTTGSITGMVYEDEDGDGVLDSPELGIANVTVSLYQGETQIASTLTDIDGVYLFTEVSPGNYSVTETDPAGYYSTTPNMVGVSVVAGDSLNVNYGDAKEGTITGVVYSDSNQNQNYDSWESGLSGNTVTLKQGETTVASTTTDSNGEFSFTGLSPGEYKVVESDRSGWYSTTSNTVSVTLSSGETEEVEFGDKMTYIPPPPPPTGSVSGKVYHDYNEDGVMDLTEPGLPGVTVELYSGETLVATTTTSGSGTYSFSNVLAGSYTVEETDPALYSSTTSNTVPVSVPAGGSATANFGDVQIPNPSVVIIKQVSVNPNGPWSKHVSVNVDDTVYFNYTIINTGNVDFDWVDVYDNITGEIIMPYEYLLAGESMENITTITASLGYVPNEVTVTGWFDDEDNVDSKDEAAYTGIVPESPAIEIIKQVSDDGQEWVKHVTVTQGNPVYFRYIITNTGDTPLSDITVEDNVTGMIDLPKTSLILGESMIGYDEIVADLGYIPNNATVIGNYTEIDVDDTDEAAYTGTPPEVPAVDITKLVSTDLVNWKENVTVTVGDPVYYNFTVTNIGDVELTGISVIDDVLGTIEISGTLAVGASDYNDTLSVMASTVGTHVNIVEVLCNEDVSDTATANYTAEAIPAVPSIQIIKQVSEDGVNWFKHVSVVEGSPVYFNYTVINTGTTTLDTISVEDNVTGVIEMPKTVLASGESMENITMITAGLEYTPNNATVEGWYTESKVESTDEAAYTGTEIPVDPSSISGMVFNDLDNDGVKDSGEPGMPGITVSLGGTSSDSTTTGSGGEYSFTNLDAGSYTVTVSEPTDYVATTTNPVTFSLSEGEDKSDVDFGLFKGGKVAGMVFDDVNENGTLDSGEIGVPGVHIQLSWGVSNSLSETTDSNGDYSFDNLVSEDYTITMTNPTGYKNTTDYVVKFTLTPEEIETVNFGVVEYTPPNPEKADIVFLLDVSSSMRYVLNDAKSKAISVMNEVRHEYGDTKFAVGSFSDYYGTFSSGDGYTAPYGYSMDYPFNMDLDMTTDTTSVLNTINDLEMLNGADFPEAFARPLNESRSYNWRSDAAKIIVLFSDAPAHTYPTSTTIFSKTYGGDPGPDGVMGTTDDLVYETVLSDLAGDGIHVVTVDCQTGFGPGVYADAHANLEYIASETGGSYYLYTSDQVDEGVIALIP